MHLTPEIEAFWQSYLISLPPTERLKLHLASVSDFGDSPELADELAQLIQAGVKSATSFLLWDMEPDETMPTVGDIEIVVDGSGRPSCIIEITEVEIKPFNEIDASFAFDYGEGDQSLDWWHREMWQSYAEECEKLGRQASETMPLVCLRFQLRYWGAG